MDFLADLVEFILELLIAIPFDEEMESKKLKTGVKTGIFCTLGALLAALFVSLSVQAWRKQGLTSGVFMTLITVAFFAFIVCGAIRGHKRGWKRDN